jgi:Fur family zinc uptake transcriptional regulator
MNKVCAHHHCHDHAPKDDQKALRLNEATALVEQAGERMTQARLRTFEMILDAAGPVKAYDLIDRFHPEGAAKPPTVYRALGFLETMGLIHRIESLNAFVACTHAHGAHAAGFFLCTCCGHSEEISTLDGDALRQRATQAHFQIDRITLEVRGLCQHCQAPA